MNSRKEDNRRALQQVANLVSVGMVFPIAIVIGYVIGYYLDRWFGTSFLKIVFLLIGIAAGFVGFYRTIVQFENDERRHNRRNR